MTRSDSCKRILALQRRGEAAAAQGEIERAGSHLSAAERCECIGNQCFLARRFQEAVDQYERAMTADAEYDIGRYHYLLGVQAERAGDFVSAFKRYQACIEIDPDFPDAYCELGGLLMKVKDYVGASRCFEDAIRAEPSHLGNYQNLVAAYEALATSDSGQYSPRLNEAKHMYERARRELPPLPEGHSW